MKITLITPELHTELTTICREHPELCFQNNGYEYIGREVREAKAEPLARIDEILRGHIAGFAEFHNFKMGKEGIRLRFDYWWEPWFKGAGYLPLDHLRDGFPVDRQVTILRVYPDGRRLQQVLPHAEAMLQIDRDAETYRGCALFVDSECIHVGDLGVRRCKAISVEIEARDEALKASKSTP